MTGGQERSDPGISSVAEYAGARVAENVPLASLTTLRVGPVARRVITCGTTDQVVATLRALNSQPGPVLVMAGGSNVVVADTITGVRLLDRGSGDVRWVPPEELSFGYRRSVLKNTVLKNTTSSVVLEVEFRLDASGRSAPLRYRELITALKAREGERTDPVRVRDAVLALRRSKGMVLDGADHDTWSVGSFFMNPVVAQSDYQRLAQRSDGPVPHFPAPDGVKLAAAWLVEQAGFGKGFPGPQAPARLSTKHSLALTNRGNATAADVVALARTVRDGVRDKFGITLIPEPVLVGVTI